MSDLSQKQEQPYAKEDATSKIHSLQSTSKGIPIMD